jgi:outer membrane lipoprotein-sorting protein
VNARHPTEDEVGLLLKDASEAFAPGAQDKEAVREALRRRLRSEDTPEHRPQPIWARLAGAPQRRGLWHALRTRRWAQGLALAAAALGVVMLGLHSHLLLDGRVSPLLFADALKSQLGKVKAITCIEHLVHVQQDGSEHTSSTTSKYYLTEDSYRRDIYDGETLREIQWYTPEDGHMLQTSVRFDLRTYSVVTHKGSFGQEDPVARLRFFVGLLDRADRRLGDQTIEGRKCIGFEVAASKYGSNPETWKTRVWFDAETKLPARIEQEHPAADQGTKARIIVQDRFDWAPEVPDGTFTPAIPPDFTKAAEAGSPQSDVAAPLTLAEVLARTAQALRSVKAYHYQMTTFGEGSGPVREIWAEGERIYARGLREGKFVSEFWADPTRIVRYDRENKKVTISDAEPRLLRAMDGVAVLRNFKPEDWQALPERRVMQDGRWYRVLELPGTGTFKGLGRSGETKTRLWIDEKTNLPARLESQLRPPETEQWERFQEVEFLWDEKEIPEDLFVPSYPVTAQVSDERRLPRAEVGEALPPVAPEVMTKPIVTLQDGVALEKLWIHPMGLVVLRMDPGSRLPSGLPPQLDSPDKNPWGLRPEEIPLATEGLLSFDEPTVVRPLGVGAVQGRWVLYLLHEFEPRADGTLAKTLTFRYLLVRKPRPSDEGRQIYMETVLKDPSAWHLYEFTVPTKDYVTDRIPEEVYGSPNLEAERVLTPALRKVLQRYEAAGNTAKVQEFIRSQGPRTQRLLENIREGR